MKRGYARVSTNGQDYESQIQALEHEGCDIIYKEKRTGANVQRQEFQRLLSEIEPGDTLVVTKMDRFARTTNEGLNVVQELFNRGVKVHVLNMGLIDNTPTGKLILTIFLAFAEFERSTICERTQEGKAIAKQDPNFKEGRPKKFSKKRIEEAVKLLEEKSYTQVEEITGISKSTLVRAKRSLKAKEDV